MLLFRAESCGCLLLVVDDVKNARSELEPPAERRFPHCGTFLNVVRRVGAKGVILEQLLRMKLILSLLVDVNATKLWF